MIRLAPWRLHWHLGCATVFRVEGPKEERRGGRRKDKSQFVFRFVFSFLFLFLGDRDGRDILMQ